MAVKEIAQDNIFLLVFPPGCGGNHLANLLSLNDKFQPRFHDADCIGQYKTKSDIGNFHLGDMENLRGSSKENILKLKNARGIPIICCHAVEYYMTITNNFKEDIYSNWSKRHIILFTFPKENSVSYRRFYLRRFGEGIDADSIKFKVSLEKYKTFYQPAIFDLDLASECLPNSIQYQSQFNNIITFETDKFVKYSGFDYVYNFFMQNFKIEIPYMGEKLHKYWYDKILSQNG